MASENEYGRRVSHTQAVVALFRALPQEWISWNELARVGGQLAWRTRISDARRIFAEEYATLEWNHNIRASAYRFVPYRRIGRDAAEHLAQKALF